MSRSHKARAAHPIGFAEAGPVHVFVRKFARRAAQGVFGGERTSRFEELINAGPWSLARAQATQTDNRLRPDWELEGHNDIELKSSSFSS